MNFINQISDLYDQMDGSTLVIEEDKEDLYNQLKQLGEIFSKIFKKIDPSFKYYVYYSDFADEIPILNILFDDKKFWKRLTLSRLNTEDYYTLEDILKEFELLDFIGFIETNNFLLVENEFNLIMEKIKLPFEILKKQSNKSDKDPQKEKDGKN